MAMNLPSETYSPFKTLSPSETSSPRDVPIRRDITPILIEGLLLKSPESELSFFDTSTWGELLKERENTTFDLIEFPELVICIACGCKSQPVMPSHFNRLTLIEANPWGTGMLASNPVVLTASNYTFAAQESSSAITAQD
jgi:hypothetical protein